MPSPQRIGSGRGTRSMERQGVFAPGSFPTDRFIRQGMERAAHSSQEREIQESHTFFPAETLAASRATSRSRDSGINREQMDMDSNSCKKSL
jgi:hypothetical protein